MTYEPEEQFDPQEEPGDAWEGDEEAPVHSRKAFLGSLLGLAVLLAFHAVQLLSWNGAESRPPSKNQAVQLEIAQDYRSLAAAGDLRGVLSYRPRAGVLPCPPLYHLSMLPFMGDQEPAAGVRWLGLIYLSLLCVCAWGLGRQFLGDWAGLGAAVFISCIPESQHLLRDPLPELALAAWVAAAYWALAASREFERRGFAALFGLCVAAAMLTKWSGAFYCLPALWVAGRACSDSWRRRSVLLAGLAAALAAPWYFAQWPVLLTRLAAAAGGPPGSAPAWTLPGVFSYLGRMIEGMDFPAFLVAAVSLAVPSARRKSAHVGVLVAWFASSYLLCTLAPDRQMRFLLAGVTPLAVLAMGPWPKAVSLGICGLQLFSAFNYPRAWVAPKTLEVIAPLSFFYGRLPKKEDWRQAEILRSAAGLLDIGGPAVLTVLSDHEYFNPENFELERKRLGLGKLEVRGPSSRVCEFSELLLTKGGSLGVEGAGRRLEDARKALTAPDGWFEHGYGEARRWSLPDGTEAVLYARLRSAKPPFSEKSIRLDYIEEREWTAEGMVIDFGAWDAGRGVYPRVGVTARSFTLAGVKVEDLALELEDVHPIPLLESATGDPKRGKPFPTDYRFARLGRLRVQRAVLSAESAEAFLKGLSREIRSASVRFDKTAVLRVDFRGLPLSSEWSVAMDEAGDRRVPVFSLRRAGLAGISVAGSLLGPEVLFRLERGPGRLPFEVDVPSVSFSDGFLRVGR